MARLCERTGLIPKTSFAAKLQIDLRVACNVHPYACRRKLLIQLEQGIKKDQWCLGSQGMHRLPP